MITLNNNARFKLPSFHIIGGSTRTFEVSLKDLFGNSSVFFCNSILENNTVATDENGANIVPNKNCIYIVENNDTGYMYYMWDGNTYNNVSFLLSVSNFAGFATNLILEKRCIAKDAEIQVVFDFNDTINTNGKFIYQLAAYTDSSSVFNYIAEQGIVIISKNIDFEENILNETDDFVYEDDDLLFVYTEVPAYIVGDIPYESNWLSLSSGGAATTPSIENMYVVSSGNYAGRYIWDETISLYIEYKE